jgi:outer membrane lipoprotein LolB
VPACLIAAALLGACATPPPAPPAGDGDALSGRMSVQVESHGAEAARSVNATFELKGDGRQGSLDLSTPLGTLLAQARWSPGQVLLTTSQGQSRFTDLDALTREVLGESVPVVALFDWLRGRPWPGAPSSALRPAAEPGFAQLGWSINLARFDDAVVAVRREQPPAVTVRAKLDRP